VTTAPDVVVVGAAARDIDERDPRGWRLGGGVTYGSLALARLGLRTGAVIGLDPLARDATELELLRDSGVEVRPADLASGPVFHNMERPTGRLQICHSASDPLPVTSVPDAWRGSGAWLLAPVAAELPDAWSDAPGPGACVAFGWQGMLRRLVPGQAVERLAPGPSALLRRATILGMSRYDVPRSQGVRDLIAWLPPRSEILMTAGPRGGILIRIERGTIASMTAYPASPAGEEVDPTGAGDVALAGFLAGRITHRQPGRALRLATLAAAALVEGPGLDSVPTLTAIRARVGTSR
jgi:sugar/nucleoside kinase (ribokinase family)